MEETRLDKMAPEGNPLSTPSGARGRRASCGCNSPECKRCRDRASQRRYYVRYRELLQERRRMMRAGYSYHEAKDIQIANRPPEDFAPVPVPKVKTVKVRAPRPEAEPKPPREKRIRKPKPRPSRDLSPQVSDEELDRRCLALLEQEMPQRQKWAEAETC